ncbi:MAG: MBL fold metallo-hydrolase [Clostridia bacterium]|nr:MBL fold metallo-hydrolase [Clostridia bacterium]
MEIMFLGTGAADWHLNEHKHLDGFRRNSSLLIDGTLLIDPGPGVPDAISTFDICASDIRFVINTHSHGDHYREDTLSSLQNAEFYPLSAGEVATMGKYTVTALPANHATAKDAIHFIISDGERSIFYGLDGAWLTYAEVKAIKSAPVDLAVLDATVGDRPGDYRIFEHNNLNMVTEIKASLEAYIKRFFISHMARTLHTSHEELSARMAGCGVEVAYDGLQVKI